MGLEWLVAVAGVASTLGVVWVLRYLWWQPLQIYKRLQAQGLRGPPFIPIVGNVYELNRLVDEARLSPTKRPSNIIVPYILPYYTEWSKIYGKTFVYCFGSEVRLTIADPELINEILSNKFGHFPKLSPSAEEKDLLGDGLLLAAGEKWAEKRRILSNCFYVDKLKAMVETASELAAKMMNNWSQRTTEAKENAKGVEIEVLEQYQNLTANIIAHIAFGTNYEAGAGKTVLHSQRSQLEMLKEGMKSIRLPLKSVLPAAGNIHRWKIRKEIEDNLHQMVQKRLKLESPNDAQQHDLLGVLISAYKGQLQGNQKSLRMSIQDIVDETKTYFVAGHETTATLLTWTTMLLGLHPDWQEKVRTEVINVCGNSHPSIDMLNRLKLVGMVLNEALRLYPANPHMTRSTHREMKLGKLVIPKGTVLSLLPLVVMHDKQLWGEDADEFNPERFSKGTANASRYPSAFMPFSLGPRNCIGQVFALIEAKVVLCKLLQNFSFELSPTYVHAPSQFSVPKPKHGLQILVKNYYRT